MRRSIGRTPTRVVLLILGGVLALGDHSHGQGGAKAPFGQPAPRGPQYQVLDRLQGSWQVTVTTRAPRAATVTYTETYEWVLDRRCLRGETSRKSDGTQDVVMVTYDPSVSAYRLWFFNSSGTAIEMPPGKWDGSSTAGQTPTDGSGSTRCFAVTTPGSRSCRDW